MRRVPAVQASLGLRPVAHPLGRSMWVSWHDHLPDVPLHCSWVCSAANICRSRSRSRSRVCVSLSDGLGLTWATPERVSGLDAVSGLSVFSWADVDDRRTAGRLHLYGPRSKPHAGRCGPATLRRWQRLAGAGHPERSGLHHDPHPSGRLPRHRGRSGRACMAWPNFWNCPLGDFYVASAAFGTILRDGFDME